MSQILINMIVYWRNLKEKRREKKLWPRLGDTEFNKSIQESHIAQLSSRESKANNNAAKSVYFSAARNISQLGR